MCFMREFITELIVLDCTSVPNKVAASDVCADSFGFIFAGLEDF